MVYRVELFEVRPLNINPRILYKSTTGISVSSSLMRGSWCIFLCWQKCTYRVLLLEILKPFALAQWVIFLVHCCSWSLASGSDAEVVNIKVIMNSRSKTLCDVVYFYIEQCHWQNTPLRDYLFLLVEIRKGWSDLDSEFPVREKTLHESGKSASQPHAMLVFRYSEPPGVVSLLQIKEDCYKMMILDVGLSYGGLQFNPMIDCRSPLSESTLRINKFVGLEKEGQPFVSHTLHSFADADR